MTFNYYLIVLWMSRKFKWITIAVALALEAVMTSTGIWITFTSNDCTSGRRVICDGFLVVNAYDTSVIFISHDVCKRCGCDIIIRCILTTWVPKPCLASWLSPIHWSSSPYFMQFCYQINKMKLRLKLSTIG